MTKMEMAERIVNICREISGFDFEIPFPSNYGILYAAKWGFGSKRITCLKELYGKSDGEIRELIETEIALAYMRGERPLHELT